MKDLLHKFIDECWDEWYEKHLAQAPAEQAEPANAPAETQTEKPTADTLENVPPTPVEPVSRELPKDKRVVRTKSTLDKVYLLDEVTKKRHWVHDPDALAETGFGFADVKDIPDDEFMTYALGPTIYPTQPTQSAISPSASEQVAPVQRLTGDGQGKN